MPRGARRWSLGPARPCVRGWRITLRPGVDERHRFIKRDRVRRLVRRQRCVDAFVADIGAVAAILRHNRAALDRMIAERPAGIGAKASSARTLGAFLGDERHSAIKADGKDFLRRFEIGVGLAVLNVRPEPADAGADRFAVLRVPANLSRQ
jgi:hypothetical protein